MEILLVPNELLRQKANRLINITSEDIKIAYQKIFSSITPWQRTLIARHPDRPKTKH